MSRLLAYTVARGRFRYVQTLCNVWSSLGDSGGGDDPGGAAGNRGFERAAGDRIDPLRRDGGKNAVRGGVILRIIVLRAPKVLGKVLKLFFKD